MANMNFTKTDNASYFDGNSSNVFYDHTTQLDWLIPILINVFFMTSTAWILVSLVHFGIKTGKWKQIQRNNEEKLNAGLVYSSVVGCATTCLVYYIFSNIYLNSGFDSSQDRLCDVTYDAGVLLYFIVLMSVGLFLWFRQHAFYANRMYNVNFSKTVRVFSFISIFLIFICGIVAMSLYVMTQQSVATSRGCTLLPSKSETTAYVVYGGFVRLLSEAILLGLFFNALRQTRINDKNGSFFTFIVHSFCCCDRVADERISKTEIPHLESNTTVGYSSNTFINNTVNSNNNDVISTPPRPKSKRRSSNDVVRKILRKTIIFDILLLIADILLFGSETLFFPAGMGDHRRFVTILSDTNVMLNLLLVIFSFVGWKRMMMSPCLLRLP